MLSRVGDWKIPLGSATRCGDARVPQERVTVAVLDSREPVCQRVITALSLRRTKRPASHVRHDDTAMAGMGPQQGGRHLTPLHSTSSSGFVTFVSSYWM